MATDDYDRALARLDDLDHNFMTSIGYRDMIYLLYALLVERRLWLDVGQRDPQSYTQALTDVDAALREFAGGKDASDR